MPPPCSETFKVPDGTTLSLMPPFNEKEASYGWGGYRQYNQSNSYKVTAAKAITVLIDEIPQSLQVTSVTGKMTYSNVGMLPKVAEWHVYGNEQQGRFLTKYPEHETYYGYSLTDDILNNIFSRQLGKKAYELKDHLGNVRTTFSDIKMPTGSGTQPFMVDLFSKSEYYPYGMKINDLSYNATGVRYGYNGEDQDNEVKGDNNSLDFGARIYDPRVGRFLSQDPLKTLFSSESNYIFAGNSPVVYIDIDGLAKYMFHVKMSKDNKSYVVIKKTKIENRTDIGWTFNAIPHVIDVASFQIYDHTGKLIREIKDIDLKNFFGTVYVGNNNPTEGAEDDDRYDIPAIHTFDLAGKVHDLTYKKVRSEGVIGMLWDLRTMEADLILARDAFSVYQMYAWEKLTQLRMKKYPKV